MPEKNSRTSRLSVLTTRKSLNGAARTTPSCTTTLPGVPPERSPEERQLPFSMQGCAKSAISSDQPPVCLAASCHSWRYVKVKTVSPEPSRRERVWELLFSESDGSAATAPYAERAAVSDLAASSRHVAACNVTAGMAFDELPTFNCHPSILIGTPERLYSSTYSTSGKPTTGPGLYITSLITTESGCAYRNSDTEPEKNTNAKNRAQNSTRPKRLISISFHFLSHALVKAKERF